jgi:hypothetical protein
MDYRRHYEFLVNRAKKRETSGYVEKHHIVPRCLGGSNQSDNTVCLTPEEHFVAHQLLVKIHPGNDRLVYALWKMGHGRHNNKMYGWVRRVYSRVVSARVVSSSTRAKFSKLWSGTGNPMYGKASPCGMKGKKHVPATRAKIAESAAKSWTAERKAALSARMSGTNSPLYGKPVSDKTRKKLSESGLGEKNSMFGKSAVAGRKWMVADGEMPQLVHPNQIAEKISQRWRMGRK